MLIAWLLASWVSRMLLLLLLRASRRGPSWDRYRARLSTHPFWIAPTLIHCHLSISYGLQMRLKRPFGVLTCLSCAGLASLEWTVAGLITGPIRGCLKPTLEYVSWKHDGQCCRWGCHGVSWGLRLGVGVVQGAAGKGCYCWYGYWWMDGARKAASWG